VPNFVSFAASIAELAHGEKSHTQALNQSLTQLILSAALGTEALVLRDKPFKIRQLAADVRT